MVRNFLFHRVNPERDPLWDPMDVKLFDKCIKHIKNNYDIVQIEDFEFLDFNSRHNRYATISFDDGYKDNIDFAAPILDRQNVKASFYVVTDCIDKNIPTWTHELKHRFTFSQKLTINLDFDFLPADFRVKKFRNKSHKIKYVLALKKQLLKTKFEHKTFLLDEVRRAFDDVTLPQIMMSWDDLRILQNEGHKIGSHSETHIMLGTTSNRDVIRKELQLSFQKIKQEIGESPQTIAYPVGSYNQVTKDLAKEVGYKYGLAVTQNVHIPNQHDLFEIPRIELYNESWLKTRMRINNSLEKIKSFIGYK
ncbi:MAG: polysaccharide deacetylase family protein [Cytophagales bacterium]